MTTSGKEYDLAVRCHQNESYDDDVKLILAYANKIRAAATENAIGYVWPNGPEYELTPNGLRLAITGKEPTK